MYPIGAPPGAAGRWCGSRHSTRTSAGGSSLGRRSSRVWSSIVPHFVSGCLGRAPERPRGSARVRSGLVGVGPPSGTVTFLFTDIEGSTRRWEADPDAMRAALALHDELLRSVIGAHDGWLFKHTGDGVCAAFGSARDAIDAAVAAQGGLALPVRMGVASGEVQERDGDYFGPTLNRVSRIMAAGHGGQVLVSDATAKSLASDR